MHACMGGDVEVQVLGIPHAQKVFAGGGDVDVCLWGAGLG